MALWKNTDNHASKPAYMGVGQIRKINASGGTGYTNGVVLTISAPPEGGIQATGNIQSVSGVMTGAVITNPGAGYTTVPTITVAGGTGGTIVAAIDSVNYDTKSIVFVDITEAQLPQNRAKGLKTPGWNMYTERTDSNGATRYKVECLIPMTTTAADAGDGPDDAIVSDAPFAITTQPAPVTVTAPAPASFTVVATGTLNYQWQVRLASGGQYTNIANAGIYANAASATLNITNSNGLNGNRYRCQVANIAVGASVTSTPAILTVG